MNYYQSKNHKRYKIKKLMYKAIGTCPIKGPRRTLEIEYALLNCTREIGTDNFGCLNSSFSVFYFYFVTNLRKKNQWRTYASRRASTFLARPPLPPASARTLRMTPK